MKIFQIASFEVKVRQVFYNCEMCMYKGKGYYSRKPVNFNTLSFTQRKTQLYV